MGIARSPEAKELLFARSAIAVHAAAFQIQSFDMVTIDFKVNSYICTLANTLTR
jgi:hypothetical protein